VYHHESYWWGQSPPLAVEGASDLPDHADVVIVGAGLVGLTSAVLMAELGLSVVVLDANVPGRGVSSQSTVKLSIAQGLRLSSIEQTRGPEHVREYAHRTLDGFELFLQIADKYNIECDLEKRDHILYAMSPACVDRLRHEVLLGQAHNSSFAAQPSTTPWRATYAVTMPDQFIFHPVKYLYGLVAAAQSMGVQIVAPVTATQLSQHAKNGIRVAGAHGNSRIIADSVVVATHVPITNPAFQFARYQQIRDYAISGIIHDDADHWATVPMTLGIDSEEPSMRTWPTPEGTRFVVTGHFH